MWVHCKGLETVAFPISSIEIRPQRFVIQITIDSGIAGFIENGRIGCYPRFGPHGYGTKRILTDFPPKPLNFYFHSFQTVKVRHKCHFTAAASRFRKGIASAIQDVGSLFLMHW